MSTSVWWTTNNRIDGNSTCHTKALMHTWRIQTLWIFQKLFLLSLLPLSLAQMLLWWRPEKAVFVKVVCRGLNGGGGLDNNPSVLGTPLLPPLYTPRGDSEWHSSPCLWLLRRPTIRNPLPNCQQALMDKTIFARGVGWGGWTWSRASVQTHKHWGCWHLLLHVP